MNRFSKFQMQTCCRAEGALTIECQRPDYGTWICECARVEILMISESGNGVRSRLCWGSKSQGSWDLHSIDEIRRGYARATRNYRLETELREASDTDFSDLTNVCRAGYPEATFCHILTYFCEICVS